MRAMTKAIVLAAAGVLAMPAGAQLLGGGALGGGGLGGLTSGVANGLGTAPVTGGLIGQGSPVDLAGQRVAEGLDYLGGGFVPSGAAADLLTLRRDRLRDLIRENKALLEPDADGNPVRRDAILATGGDIAKAQSAGFVVARKGNVEGLDLPLIVLTPPKGLSAKKALDALRAADPSGAYSLDHVYEPARGAIVAEGGGAAGNGAGGGAAMGLIDGGVGNHPAFAGSHIVQRGFAGDPRPTGHGTAVASLMVGRAGAFKGVLPGGSLMVADVYGGSPANGSAEAIVRAMGWLAAGGVRVVNISLVGAADPVLAAGVKALQARGIAVVAAVGNDGPAAPPQYPASYAQVIAVTAVDGKGRLLPEAGRATHLDFAAPGADLAGAVPGGKWEALRGTSFAAPLVAASLARAGSLDALAAAATPKPRAGHGLVCAACATPPAAVGLQ